MLTMQEKQIRTVNIKKVPKVKEGRSTNTKDY